ncbi:hypothetical protein LCGC14_1205150 [marine sediment metagenome]|uniref:Uncharacterized protein n=1 Tax=marine sediment metagenome TaxID=412755 RepID=A0A0F9M376_9ZZZZ
MIELSCGQSWALGLSMLITAIFAWAMLKFYYSRPEFLKEQKQAEQNSLRRNPL